MAAPDPQDLLRPLGHWARSLRIGDVPGPALHAARAQLAHIQGRVPVAAATLDLPASNAKDASLYGAFDGDGHILGARTGVGLATLRSVNAADLTVERLLLACVIGAEIGARIGLATLLGDRATSSSARPGAAAGAAAIAWLGGADGEGIARAVGAAVGLAATGGAHGAAFGALVAEAAMGGAQATGSDPSLALGLWAGVADPIPGALAVDGRWLSSALVLPELCVPAALATAIEAVHEILLRHVRAAEKRLRADQIERIELRVPFATWAADQAEPRLAELVGRLVAFHALGPLERHGTATLSEGIRVDKSADIAAVASRVEITHDYALSVGLVRSAVPYTGPLSLSRYRALRRTLPTAHLPDLLAALRARPDRLFRAVSAEVVAPLAFPVQVKLYTSRGGWWPERRSVANGALDVESPLPAPFDAPLDAAAGPLLGAT